MPGVSDPYRQLGVERSASAAQIKTAHRTLAKRYHPDSPTADAQRFLRVQEAYQLLSDPLRRREWDARHAPAPIRADEPAPATPRARGRRSATAGRDQAAREQPARSYTWSASEVPWWEDSGRRGPRTTPPGAGAQRPAAGSANQADAPAASRPRPRRGSTQQPPGEAAPRADFDVYNRSSGAAWSSAARAYFRRADADLPSRGSFRYQGSQPLTAARARAAAEQEARRRGPTAAPADSPAQPRDHDAAPAARATARAAAPEAGVARDVEAIYEVRAKVRAEERASRWPSRWQRLRYAALAWLPLALLVGYGGPLAAGCQPALANCPPTLLPAQALLATLLLGGLAAAPRLAYAGALATTAIVLGGSIVLAGAWLSGLRAPQLAELPPWALLGGAALLAVAYLIVGVWLLADRARRPWVGAWVRR